MVLCGLKSVWASDSGHPGACFSALLPLCLLEWGRICKRVWWAGWFVWGSSWSHLPASPSTLRLIRISLSLQSPPCGGSSSTFSPRICSLPRGSKLLPRKDPLLWSSVHRVLLYPSAFKEPARKSHSYVCQVSLAVTPGTKVFLIFRWSNWKQKSSALWLRFSFLLYQLVVVRR